MIMDKKKKQMVFFCSVAPYVMIYKIAKEFKKKGYETILVTISGKDKFDVKSFEDAFDKILCSDFQFFKPSIKSIPYFLKKSLGFLKFLISLKMLKPYVWFGIGRTNWQIMLAHKYFFRKYPFIFFEYDLNSHFFSSRQEARGWRVPNFEINAEKYCFENADGIMHKGAPDELNVLDGRIFSKINLPDLKINFLPYCSKDYVIPLNKNKLSKKDGELHLVFIGGLFDDPASNKYENELVTSILNNKIHFHNYAKLQHLSPKESYEYTSKKFGKFLENPYFHLHPALDPKEIIKEISKYDFGVWFSGNYYKRKGLEIKYSTGNKLSSYLEAGIPLIYDERLEFVNLLLKKYNLNLAFNNKNFNSFFKNLKNLNYNSIEKNVQRARKDFSVEKHFPRLEKFVKKVVARKNKIS